jgi:hypothetical protein
MDGDGCLYLTKTGLPASVSTKYSLGGNLVATMTRSGTPACSRWVDLPCSMMKLSCSSLGALERARMPGMQISKHERERTSYDGLDLEVLWLSVLRR